MGVILAALVGAAAPAEAGAHYPGDFTKDGKLAKLKKKVGAKDVAIVGSEHLAKTMKQLAAAKAGQGAVRFLHLGDSHIASDYITSRIRHRLQKKYGNGGRGFVHVAQLWGYGGRRLHKSDEKRWASDRIVDKDRAGRPYGFSGRSFEAKKNGARLRYWVDPAEKTIRIYYYTQPGGGKLTVDLDGTTLGSIETNGPESSLVWTMDVSKVPRAKKRAKTKGPPGRLLTIVGNKKARLFGLSFERGTPGVIYESIGPVGADAKVYLQLGRDSFKQHLSAHAPDVVVLMVGGNDALKIRKKWTDPAKVRKDHETLIDLLRAVVPGVEIILWSPMDAGDRKKGKVVSKGHLHEMRTMQREVSAAKKIAFWDTLDAMGGVGSIARWDKARVMNKDLVHPKKAAADLLGDLFAGALLP